MTPAVRLGVFAVALAALFGAGAAVGAVAGPIGEDDDAVEHDDGGHGDDAPDEGAGGVADVPGGVTASVGELRLVVDSSVVDAGVAGPFTFRIVGEHGHPVTEFDVVHDKRLHLILASRDLLTFHHLHPEMDGHGEWSVDLPALRPGSYRAFADFQATGFEGVTLGSDVLVPGAVEAAALPNPATTATIDGFDVGLVGTPAVGSSVLTFDVTHAGASVEPEPYLGALGHLVALRAADLAYLHVHPEEGSLSFAVEFPSAGRYRLFLDFSVDGVVRTASFTVEVPS